MKHFNTRAEMNRSFPNFKQSLILLSFYFLPPGLILFLTITLPQIFGLEVSRIYITSSSIIAATIGLIPLILYINKNSGIQFNWTIQSPSLKTILFLTILASAIFIISDPFTNIREFIYIVSNSA